MSGLFTGKRKKGLKRCVSILLALVVLFTSLGLENFVHVVEAATTYTTIYLKDDTAEHWLGNDNAVIELVDNTSGHTHYKMKKENNTTWSVRVPATTFNVTFNRLSPDGNTQWNSWSAGGRGSNRDDRSTWHSTYHATVPEHGYWDGKAENTEGFHEGDIIYLDYYEFQTWENADALFHVNFTGASKADNGGKDISLGNADAEKFSPVLLTDEIEEQVYTYTVTKEDEGAAELRFWRGNNSTLWNASVKLKYTDYQAGNNCVKVQGWDDTGYVCPYVPRRHVPVISSTSLDITGNKKVNRKITVNLDIQGETEYLNLEGTKITIEKTDSDGQAAAGETEEENLLYDASAGTWNHRELIFRESGTYKVSTETQSLDGADTYTTEETITIADDNAPVAGISLMNAEDGSSGSENVFVRNAEGLLHLKISDESVSELNDEITERDYTICYDADNNGEYEEGEKISRTAGNETGLSLQLDKAGKYQVRLNIRETFTDTIPELLTEEDYLTGEVIKEFEIVNQAPVSSMSVRKSKTADIIFTVGNADSDKLTEYAAASETVKNRLEEQGIEADVSTVSTSALTATDTFAWKEFDHCNFNDWGRVLPKHIQCTGKDIKMVGYYYAPFKDFLYVNDNDSNKKIFEFDLQRDHTDWHSMEGGGFLFNTAVSEEENYIQGYCILVASRGLKLMQIHKTDLTDFRNSTAYVQDAGRLLQIFPMEDLYASHHFKIIINGNTITVYDGEKIIINEYVLPDDGVEAYGYGPVTSHENHGCYQQSYFTFKNIIMQTVTGESLSDVVNNHEWTPGENHYVINLSETGVPELSDSDRMGDVAAALISNNASFYGIGNSTTVSQYNALLNSIDGMGENIELTGTGGDDDSITVTGAVDRIVSSITADINSKDYEIEYVISSDEKVEYKDTYHDPDGDEKGEEVWTYLYDRSVFGGDADGIQTLNRTEPITMFTDTGAYTISHRISDNPAGGNEALAGYSRWSDEDSYRKLILSQHRPVAEITIAAAQSPADRSVCMVNVQYSSHDEDHMEDAAHGIRNEEFYYKELGDTEWTEGRFPSDAAMGSTYLVKYTVTDIEGTKSRPAAAAVKTNEAREYVEPADTNPPKVSLTVSEQTAETGSVFYVEASAEDDYGITAFSIKHGDEEIGTTYGRFECSASEAGEYVITVSATDIGGNTVTDSRTVHIIDTSDVTPPVIEIASPVNGNISGDTDITGTIKDDKKLKSYTVARTRVNTPETDGSNGSADESVVIAAGTEEIINGTIATIETEELRDGLYRYEIAAEDMAGNTANTACVVTVTKDAGDRIPPQAAISDIILDNGNGTISVYGSVSDDTELSEYRLYVRKASGSGPEELIGRGSTGSDGGILGTVDTDSLDSGEYYLRLTASDTGGNTCESTAEFTFVKDTGSNEENINVNQDLTAPVIMADLKAAITDGRLKIHVNGTVEDENLASYDVITGRLDADGELTGGVSIAAGTEPVIDGTIAAYTYPSYETGDYGVQINAADEAGNVRTVTYTITINSKGLIDDGYGGEEDDGGAGNEGLLNLTLSKTTADVGEDINAYFSYPKSAENVSLTAEGGTVNLSGRSAAITSQDAGEITVTLSAVIDGETKSVQKSIRFFDPADTAPPTVDFISPEPDSDLNSKADIYAAISDETGLAYYILEYRMDGDGENYKEIARGTEPVENAKIGELDTTLLMNGSYILRITAVDNGGNRIRAERTVNVTGNLKVGNMALGFTDINSNVAGLPLTVTRNYDSRNKSAGDFGYGWMMGIQSAKLTESNDIRSGYNLVQQGDRLSTCYYMEQTLNHDITVTYGDGTSDKFELKLTPERSALIPIYEVKVTFQCVTDKKVKLELDGDNTALVSGGQLLFEDTDMFENHSYILTRADGTKLYLSTEYGLLKMEDSNGNTVSITKNGYRHSSGNSVVFTRDDKGRINKAEEKNSKGEVITEIFYGYDNAGDLISVTDTAGRTVSFTYDEEHNLADIIDPSGIAVARNIYDEDGRLTATVDADGNRVEYEHDLDAKMEVVRDRLGNATVYYYDDNGNILRTVDALGNVTENTYDENNNVLTKTDANGNVIRYEYDGNNNITKRVNADGTVADYVYNSNSQINSVSVLDIEKISIDYDDRLNITSVKDANDNATDFEYANDGRLKSISDAMGIYHQYEYDNEGNLSKLVDGNGNIISYSYDEKGYLISKSVTRTAENGTETIVTQYINDAAGKILQEISDDGSVTFYEYDINGRMTAKVDSLERRMEYSYNNLGNIESISYPDGTADYLEYDAMGNTTKIVDRNGITENMLYDKLGRLVKIEYSNGTEEKYEYDAVGNVKKSVSTSGAETLYEYDELNRNTVITDCHGNRTAFEYNEYSQLIKTVDAKGNVWQYEYDVNGNQTKTIYPDGTEYSVEYDARNQVISRSDAYGNKTLYEYDGIGNLVRVKDALGGETKYQYDELGNLTKVTDAAGNSTVYEYSTKERYKKTIDALGRESICKYDGAGNIIWYKDGNGKISTYKYNENDCLVDEINEDGETKYTYDSINRLKEVRDKNGTISYRYDSYGRLVSKSMTNGEEISYTYDEFNRLSEKQLKINGIEQDKSVYEYDLSDRITRVVDRNGEATVYEYDELGNRTAVKYANGITMCYKYDACSRLMEEHVVDKDNVPIYIYQYRHGLNGEVKEIEENGPDGCIITRYEYDALNRLLKETISDEKGKIENEYAYNAVGNRTAKNTILSGNTNGIYDESSGHDSISAGETVYTYNELGQLVCEENNGIEIKYDYDTNGNLIRQECNDVVRQYSYDSKNLLTGTSESVAGQETQKENYEYDYEGNRIAGITGNARTSYVIDSSGALPQINAEYNNTEDGVVVYHRGLELDYMETAGKRWYYIYDGHGDVRALVNENGDVTDSYRYDAYGNMLKKTGTVDNHFLYTGQYYDEFTGLYYLRARYMNPEKGSFISMDTYEGNREEPLSLNKYLYVNANPVGNYDPDGHMALLVGMAIDTNITLEQTAYNAAVLSMGMACLRALKDMTARTNVHNNLYYVTEMVVEGIDVVADSAGDVAANIRDYVEEKVAAGSLVRKKDGAIYTVYTFADVKGIEKLETNTIENIKYVGRTKDYEERRKQHRYRGVIKEHPELKEGPRYENLTYEVCRGLEQTLMVFCHTRAWLGEGGYNKINGVAQKNKKGDLYYVDSISYIENQIDNEKLCLSENMHYGSWWK